jgi:hypothetical protein
MKAKASALVGGWPRNTVMCEAHVQTSGIGQNRGSVCGLRMRNARSSRPESIRSRLA